MLLKKSKNKSSDMNTFKVTSPNGDVIDDMFIQAPNNTIKVVATRSGEPAYWAMKNPVTYLVDEDRKYKDPIFVNRSQSYRGVVMDDDYKELQPISVGDIIIKDGEDDMQIKEIIKVDRSNVFCRISKL